MSNNRKQTSPKVASLAAETLSDPNASGIAKSLAASALAQSSSGKQTGADMETKAAKALENERSSDLVKTLAATVLAQSNKER